jgi:hypothetical protein
MRTAAGQSGLFAKRRCLNVSSPDPKLVITGLDPESRDVDASR